MAAALCIFRSVLPTRNNVCWNSNKSCKGQACSNLVWILGKLRPICLAEACTVFASHQVCNYFFAFCIFLPYVFLMFFSSFIPESACNYKLPQAILYCQVPADLSTFHENPAWPVVLDDFVECSTVHLWGGCSSFRWRLIVKGCALYFIVFHRHFIVIIVYFTAQISDGLIESSKQPFGGKRHELNLDSCIMLHLQFQVLQSAEGLVSSE